MSPLYGGGGTQQQCLIRNAGRMPALRKRSFRFWSAMLLANICNEYRLGLLMKLKSLDDNDGGQQIIERVQGHARPDRACLPSEDGE